MIVEAVRRIRAAQGSFAIGTLVTIGFNGLSLVAYGGGSILVARGVGPTIWGDVLWFVTGTSVIATFADVLGIFYSNSYLVAKRDNVEALPTARATVLAYALVLGVISASLVVGVGALRLLAFPTFGGGGWAPLVFLNIVGLTLNAQIRGLLIGTRSFILLGLLTFVKSGGFGILAVIVVYLLEWRSAEEVVRAQVFTTWVAVLAGAAYLVKRGLARPAISYLRKCMAFGWRGAGINGLSFLHQRVDQYLVSVMLGKEALGLYGVAVSLGEVITQIPAMMGSVLLPITAADHDPRQLARATLKRTLVVMGAMAVLMIPLILEAPRLIGLLYGPAFVGAVEPLRAFAPAMIFLAGLYLLNSYVAGFGYPLFQLLAMGLGLLCNVAVNLVLIPRLRIVGASLASVISYSVWLVLMGAFVVIQGRRARAENAERPPTTDPH
jgi:O-antigen/teichoic acid export membrane protein